MKMTAKFIISTFLGLCAFGATAGTASAQAKVEVGTLTCVGGEGVGLVIGSQKTYACRFTTNSGKRQQRYDATVTKIGLDIGVTGKSTMVWTVFAATQNVRPGLLRGTYAGASADAALGIGGGAKVLVGGSGNSIALQPVSVQGQSGINLAIGVASMKLR
jgi:Protein of unknown function (DUF992)